MTPELFWMIATSLVAIQLVAIILRRELAGERPYALLLGLDLVALGWVHHTRQYASVVAFVAEASACVLTLAPLLLDRLERRALARDRVGTALRLAAIRELVMPGRASTRRRRHLQVLSEARRGGTRVVLDRLAREVAETRDPKEAAALHEEIAIVLFLSQRPAEALGHVRAHVSQDALLERPGLAAYVVRGLAELGAMAEAIALLERLEGAPATRDVAGQVLLQHARLAILALAGRSWDLARILDGAGGAVLSAQARTSLLETAAARGALSGAAPAELEAALDGLSRRAAAFSQGRRPTLSGPAPGTRVLLAINLVVFAALAALIATSDEGWIIRAGALFRPAVLAGQWWRLVTALFLHAGVLHVLLNMYALRVLGRLTEQLLGTVRFLVVYFVGGLIGGLSSIFLGGGTPSVGASGAIMGLLGAVIVSLALGRGAVAEPWRRTVLVNLMVLGGLQVVIGFALPMIDNAAHVGGLLGGAACAVPAVLLPRARSRASVRLRVLVWAIAGVLTLGFVAHGLAHGALDEMYAQMPVRRVDVGRCSIEIPAHFSVDVAAARVADPYLGVGGVVECDEGSRRVLSEDREDARLRGLFERMERSIRPRG